MKHGLRFPELQTVNIQTANISDAYGIFTSQVHHQVCAKYGFGAKERVGIYDYHLVPGAGLHCIAHVAQLLSNSNGCRACLKSCLWLAPFLVCCINPRSSTPAPAPAT
jgi:hypothetical protein